MATQRENRVPESELDDRMVPPYEGRSEQRGGSESAEALGDSIERQLERTDRGNPGATSSPAHESPVGEDEVSHGDTTTPLGVGESVGRRGEDISRRDGSEPGRVDTGPRGATQRPSGTSTARDATGVDPQDPRDADAPNLPPGDQGG